MKIIGLDNREYSWNFIKYSTPSENYSSLHLRARILLKTMFPYDVVGEELVIPGVKTEINNRPLLLDFYIHFQRIAVEVQGQQHSEYTPFFHTNKLEFFRAKRLDGLKRQWCLLNNITLVELPYNLSDEQWSQIIRNR
jgi:hypothetical protein